MMKSIIFSVVTVFSFFYVSQTSFADQCLYLSAGSTITVYEIDESAGKLKVKQKIDLQGAGPLTASPDNRHLYACAAGTFEKKRSPAIATYQVADDGKIKLLKIAPTNLRAGYLRTDKTGRFMAGNHYGPGKVTIWQIDKGIYQGKTVQELTQEQQVHCAQFSPDNRWLLAPATGPNKVFQNRFDAKTGKAKPNEPAYASGPKESDAACQPRHLIFHPTKKIIYTSNERKKPGVGVWQWDAKKGTMKIVQNIVSSPADFKGVITTADLHLTPDAKFLYLSNRDTTKRNSKTGKDSIVAFSVDAKTGRLTKVGNYPCEHIPRSFVLDTKGNYLYVTGQGDSRLGVYKIDKKTGALAKVTQYKTGSSPIWVHCMTPPKK